MAARDKFARRLYELRKSRGLTQAALGAAIGVAQNTVANWEAAKREPDLEMLIRLSDFFKVSVDWLLARKAPGKGGPSHES